jgi:hypothetical protein
MFGDRWTKRSRLVLPLLITPRVCQLPGTRSWKYSHHSGAARLIAVCIATGSIRTWIDDINFLGAFAKSRKATISFVLSVRLSAWNSSVPTWRILMKYGTWAFLRNIRGGCRGLMLRFITHSAGFSWRSDRPVAETSPWQHTSKIRTRNPSKRATSDPRFRPLSHLPPMLLEITYIHSFISNLSYDRSTASSKTIPPLNAIITYTQP